MKIFIALLSCLFVITSASAQERIQAQPEAGKAVKRVKTGCGKCMFYMKWEDCELAVRMNGKTYVVEGTTIADHGDEHAVEGLCSAVRKADVQGEIRGENFVTTYFRLVENRKTKKQKEPSNKS